MAGFAAELMCDCTIDSLIMLFSLVVVMVMCVCVAYNSLMLLFFVVHMFLFQDFMRI